MRPYTELIGLEAIVLEESYVLGICATPGAMVLQMDFVLTPDHPDYKPPPTDEIDCFRRGRIEITGVRSLVWKRQGAAPAVDATGEIDYGHLEAFTWDGATHELAGDFGQITLVGSAPRVGLENAQSNASRRGSW